MPQTSGCIPAGCMLGLPKSKKSIEQLKYSELFSGDLLDPGNGTLSGWHEVRVTLLPPQRRVAIRGRVDWPQTFARTTQPRPQPAYLALSERHTDGGWTRPRLGHVPSNGGPTPRQGDVMGRNPARLITPRALASFSVSVSVSCSNSDLTGPCFSIIHDP